MFDIKIMSRAGTPTDNHVNESLNGSPKWNEERVDIVQNIIFNYILKVIK